MLGKERIILLINKNKIIEIFLKDTGLPELINAYDGKVFIFYSKGIKLDDQTVIENFFDKSEKITYTNLFYIF